MQPGTPFVNKLLLKRIRIHKYKLLHIYVNYSGAQTGIFKKTYATTMAVNACVLDECCCMHRMMTSSNGNVFRALTLCTWICEFPSKRPVTRSFEVLFDLRVNKRLSKQSRDWWFETPSRSSWRHCYGHSNYQFLLSNLEQRSTVVRHRWNVLTDLSICICHLADILCIGSTSLLLPATSKSNKFI